MGPQGYAELASLPEASTVLSAQMGAAGLRATMAAAEAGKVICLANKESLVLAGGMLRETCARTGAWFSSALWPFSTLGWPEKTEDLDYFYA